MGFAIVELFTTWLWRLVSNSRSKPTSSFIFIFFFLFFFTSYDRHNRTRFTVNDIILITQNQKVVSTDRTIVMFHEPFKCTFFMISMLAL